MKKLAAVLFAFVFLIGNIYGATSESRFEKRLEKIKYPSELDFKGTPLSDALSTISKTSNINMVAASEIADLPIDLYLPKGQTLKRIIETIKNTNGLVSRIVNGTMILSRATNQGVKVASKGKVVGKVTEIDKITGIRGVTLSLGDDINTLVLSDVGGAFIIGDVNPGTYILKASLRGYKPNAEIVEVKPGGITNINIVLAKVESAAQRSGKLTSKQDIGKVVKTNGDIRNTKMINLIYADPKDVKGIVTNIVPLDNIVVDEKNNILILIGTEDNIKTATKLIEKLDIPTKQIRIKAKIWDINQDVVNKVGLNWTAVPIDGEYQLSKNSSDGTFLTGSKFNGTDGMTLSFMYGGINNENALGTTLNMLASTNDAEILAEPEVTTLNGKEANIQIVNEEIVGYKETSDDKGNSDKSPLFKDAGVVLRVKPIIKSDETILIEFYSKVSKFTSDGVHGAAEKKSETTTKIRVKNGETIRIGGLVRQDKGHGVTKTPILGDIPLIGILFQNSTTTNNKRNLYIELTPEIVK
ncbi:secretin N-terminal domain-containing protein [Haliovirga abyssi]|uniref:Uncharacterized protein n=1 Tax=Haliovirga abyssi TaxID=2996794 RepID=A0AAU9D8K6_9FUSO|nr:secretin N-terminal domain-containing protein [Haliovirga abyssi]BDU49585.1 hypothetical protein HLVA_01540 [Haliovirga abyssi]